MTWWTDLWLNEGFATWVGNFAIDNFFKEWDIWTQFVNQYTNRALQVRQKSPRTTKEPYFSGGANGKEAALLNGKCGVQKRPAIMLVLQLD